MKNKQPLFSECEPCREKKPHTCTPGPTAGVEMGVVPGRAPVRPHRRQKGEGGPLIAGIMEAMTLDGCKE